LLMPATQRVTEMFAFSGHQNSQITLKVFYFQLKRCCVSGP